MSETVAEDAAQPETSEPTEEPVSPPRFPWPPAAESGAIAAFVRTVEESMRSPSAFFRAMPVRGYGSALSYFLIVGVLAAGMRLFWSNLFELIGYQPFARVPGVSNPDALDRLISFLLQPLFLVSALFVVALIAHASLHIVGAARAPFVATTRTFAFSSGPQLFVVVPFIGPLAALLGTIALFTIGLREVHQTSIRRVLLAFALPLAALLVLALIGLLVFVLVVVATFALRI